VTQPPGGTATKTGTPGVRVHAAALPPGHVTTHHGVPVTTAARTAADLARREGLRAGVMVADSALRSRQASREELQAVLSACARWPGIGRARRAIAASDARSESALESLARVVFAEHGLSPPDLQVWVGGDGVVGRADFLWREHRTIAEADGALKYADPARAREQLWRDARLREAGFEVVHFTWDEITHTPAHVVAAIRTAFGRGTLLAAAAGRHAAAAVPDEG
jgi:hypothetical protein